MPPGETVTAADPRGTLTGGGVFSSVKVASEDEIMAAVTIKNTDKEVTVSLKRKAETYKDLADRQMSKE